MYDNSETNNSIVVIIIKIIIKYKIELQLKAFDYLKLGFEFRIQIDIIDPFLYILLSR